MSGERLTTTTLTLPAPTGGINLQDIPLLRPETPTGIAENESPDIRNYFVFDSALRARGEQEVIATFAGEYFSLQLFTFYDSAGAAWHIVCTATKIYKVNSSSLAVTDITGALSITSGAKNGVIFNGYLFICNLASVPVVRISPSTVASNPGFTGPTPNDSVLGQAWSYRNRLYFTEKGSNVFWYGAVDAVAGALTSFDLASVFETSGELLFGTNWSSNQEEYCVFVNTQGELLIYSGDWPASPNWQLVGRSNTGIPAGTKSFVKFGGDILLATDAGFVSLAQIVSTLNSSPVTTTLSDKINKSLQLGLSSGEVTTISQARKFPFIYAPRQISATIPEYGLWILNYESGAWSTLVPEDAQGYAQGLSWLIGNTYFVYGDATDGYLAYFKQSQTDGAPARSWRTPWADFGTVDVKQLDRVLLTFAIVQESDSDDITYTCSVYTDFDSVTPVVTEALSATGDAANNRILQLQFSTSCVAKQFQVEISAAGGGLDEIYNLQLDLRQGGLY